MVELRGALIDAAAQVIATEGPTALRLRRIADEVGTSTMAVYTHFGGMPGLRRAVRLEWFARLGDELSGIEPSDDPVADLALLGRVYYMSALRSPHLYRVTFMEAPLDDADVAVGAQAFSSLVATVKRCLAASRFKADDAELVATEFWALGHGVIALQLAQLLSMDDGLRSLDDALVRLFVGNGDDPDTAQGSLEQAGVKARGYSAAKGMASMKSRS